MPSGHIEPELTWIQKYSGRYQECNFSGCGLDISINGLASHYNLFLKKLSYLSKFVTFLCFRLF